MRVASTTKGNSENMDAPLVKWAPQLCVISPGPQHLSTNNTKDSSTSYPPMPTRNLVLIMDTMEVSCNVRPKRAIIKPTPYRDVDGITNNVSV